MIFEVVGLNFIPFYAPFRIAFTSPTGTVFIGAACVVTDKANYSHISCTSPRGWGEALVANLVYGRFDGTAPYNGTVARGSAAVGYAAPVITSITTIETSVGNLSTSGQQWVHVDVVNLAPDLYGGTPPMIMLKYGNAAAGSNMEFPLSAPSVSYSTVSYSCFPIVSYCPPLVVNWTSQRVSFQTVVGTGGPYAVFLSMGDQSATSMPSIAHGAPVISNVTSSSPLTNLSVLGGQAIIIDGDNFGASGLLVTGVLSAPTNEGGAPGAVELPVNCTVTVGHRRLLCTSPSASGGGLSFVRDCEWSAAKPLDGMFYQLFCSHRHGHFSGVADEDHRFGIRDLLRGGFWAIALEWHQ